MENLVEGYIQKRPVYIFATNQLVWKEEFGWINSIIRGNN
jgi:hypothetical protein